MSSKSSPAFTASELAERALYRRAVEAVIWGMPLVNTDAMRQAYFRDVGEVQRYLLLLQSRGLALSSNYPNASTNYVYFNFNLKDGPVVTAAGQNQVVA